MRIFFDQGVPVPLRRHLPGHTIDTAYERGWSTLKNGNLTDAVERDGYDVLVSTDQNLKHQQNLAGRKFAFPVLLSTSWPQIELRVADIQKSIATIKAADYVELTI